MASEQELGPSPDGCLQPAVLLEDHQQSCGMGEVAHQEDEAEPNCSGGSGHKDKEGKPG